MKKNKSTKNKKTTPDELKLWGGRFEKKIANEVLHFSESISFDYKLAEFDIQQSLVHIEGLNSAGIISDSELIKLKTGFERVYQDIKNRNLPMPIEYEDIHTAIEKQLIKYCGDLGKKVHTTRSRNDQVATDIRLYLKKQIQNITQLGKDYILVLCNRAMDEAATLMPGYTHLQRAMPVTMGHHLMAYASMFYRDLIRFDNCYHLMDSLPLGSGALAGTNFSIPRAKNASKLGFSKVISNSLDSVADRDFALEYLSCVAIMMTHFSRLSEDLILWSSAEFNYISIDDAFATGSSLMPQKKNPDVSELTRGKSGRTIANLMGLFTVMKGLPLSYNRDLQEDKEFLFDSTDTLKKVLEVHIPYLRTIIFKRDVMLSALESDPAILATDLADILVKSGMPFRTTHEVVGNIVKDALKQKRKIQSFKLEEFRKYSHIFPENTCELLNVHVSVENKKTEGGTCPKNVIKQVNELRKQIKLL